MSRRVVAIVQARVGSTRLPRKVLADICGRPMLAHVIERLQRAHTLAGVCVATTTSPEDELVCRIAADLGAQTYAGSVDDVLDRYYQAALQVDADVIVRITSDCPLIDARVVDAVVSTFLQGDYDYVSNTLHPTYPDGLDTEVFSMHTLAQAWREARMRSEREHVTPYIRKHPESFRLFNVEHRPDLSSLRWTVDQRSDLEFVQAIFSRLYPTPFEMDDVLRLLHEHADLARINDGIARNEGYQRSLHEDGIVRPKEE